MRDARPEHDAPPQGLFVTATGTGCGKTWVTRGLARALVRAGRSVAALKPIETGVDPSPLDAEALARACGRPALAHAPGLLRARSPLSPLAATLEGELPAVEPVSLATVARGLVAGVDVALVEGAGGLLVPLSPNHDTRDLALALGWPLLLVARDAIGTLSHTLTALECAAARGLAVHALVLTRGPWSMDDPSVRTNLRILAARVSVPVLSFPACPDDDEALADAAGPLAASLG
jgi:dethiobiotin synthetase